MIAEFARKRSLANFRRCGDAHKAPEKRRFLHRSIFWSDVQEWADGLSTWRAIRARRKTRREDSPISADGAIFFLVAMVVIWLVCALMAAIASAPKARSAEAGEGHDPARAAFFHGLKQPGTDISCCDISDCRKTRAEWKAGGWRAEVLMPDGSKAWTAIPPSKVLLKPPSIDGEAYLCQSKGNVAGPAYSDSGGLTQRSASDPIIYCFIPPVMGF